METVFNFARQACGLSAIETSRILKTPEPIVKSWCVGLQEAPKKAIAVLLDLAQRQNKQALKIGTEIYRFQQNAKKAKKDYKIVLTIATNDQEAQEKGWPSASAYNAIIRRVIERMPPGAADRMTLMPMRKEELPASAQSGLRYWH